MVYSLFKEVAPKALASCLSPIKIILGMVGGMQIRLKHPDVFNSSARGIYKTRNLINFP